jgi:hypothetical protein
MRCLHLARSSALSLLLLVAASPSPAAVYHYSAILNPRQEVPPVASNALGAGRFIIDTDANTMTYWISYAGLVGTENNAHIHGYAAGGTNAGVVHQLAAGNPKVGVWNYPEADEASILGGLSYANIHSTFAGGGEMRGQIVPLNALLTPTQENPPTPTTGSGWATATIDTAANSISWRVFYEGLTGAPTLGHLHGNANYGTNVGVKIGFGALASPIVGSGTYNEADEFAIMSGRWYVNIHTAAHGGGEIRGQLVPRVVPMDAVQEFPVNDKLGSAGVGMVAIDTVANVLGFDVRVVALSSAETAAHIHGFADLGANADVLQALPAGTQKLGTWNYGAANETDVLLGRTYFNVHTENHGGGEIRGQITGLPGAEALLDVGDEKPRTVPGLSAAPNPSPGGMTRLTFQLSRSGSVSLAIVGVDGRALRSVPATLYAPGPHSFEWDGRDDDGRLVAPGVYFAVARTPDGEKVTRIARLR